MDEGDLALLLSNSGQTEEIVRLVPLLKRFGLRIVALTSNPDSDLARSADHRLLYHVPREACPLRLAPTASTTASMINHGIRQSHQTTVPTGGDGSRWA